MDKTKKMTLKEQRQLEDLVYIHTVASLALDNKCKKEKALLLIKQRF